MKSKILLLYTFLSFILLNVKSQNLVPNPSFEMIADCDLYFDEFEKTKDWKGYNFTPDIFNACSKAAFLGVPFNVFDRQPAATGKGYAGLLTYHKDYPNEVIGAKLINPLQKGEKYKVSFKTSRAKSHAQYATNNLGVLFTNTPEKAYNSKQVHINHSEVITESEVWITIEGIFEADQAYQYITIGNFFDKQSTSVEKLAEGTFEAAYYFIEDVSVSKVGTSTETTTLKKEEIPNKEEKNFKKEETVTIAFAGKVLDAETKRPLVAMVEFIVPNTTTKKDYETDYMTGQFAFTNLAAPKSFLVKISARNYYTITQTIQLKDEKRIKKEFYLQQLHAGQDIELRNVSFKSGLDELNPASFEELNQLIQLLRDNPTMKIQTSGYTDDQSQTELARKRAKAIKDYLEKIGKINPNRISTQAYYETTPSRQSAAAADEPVKVERVEFKILN